MKKQGAHGGNAPTMEGARSGNTPGMEGKREPGKTNHELATLRHDNLPGAVKVPNSLGNHQAESATPTGESNHESLRHGRMPQAERVKSHPAHSNVQRAAHSAAEASKYQPAKKAKRS